MALEVEVIVAFNFFGWNTIATVAAIQAIVLTLEQELRDVGVRDTVLVMAANQGTMVFVRLQFDVFQTAKAFKRARIL